MKRPNKIDPVLTEAIKEGLSIVCSSASHSVFFFLKNNGSIESETNIGRLEEFSEGLKQIFGCGSKIIEKQILIVLYLKLHLASPTRMPAEFEFSEEVNRAFKLCETSQITKNKQS